MLRSQQAPISIKKHLNGPLDTLFFGESDIPKEQIPPLPEYDPMYAVVKSRQKEFGENSWNYSWNRGDEARQASLQSVCRQALGWELSNELDEEFEKAVQTAEKQWVELASAEENPDEMFDEYGNMKPEFISQERERLAEELGSDHHSSDYSSSCGDSDREEVPVQKVAKPKRRVLGVKKTDTTTASDKLGAADSPKEVAAQTPSPLALPGITARADIMENRSQSESAVPAPLGGAGGLGLMLPGIQARSGGRLDNEPHSVPIMPGSTTMVPSFGKIDYPATTRTTPLTDQELIAQKQNSAHQNKIRMALAKKNLLKDRPPQEPQRRRSSLADKEAKWKTGIEQALAQMESVLSHDELTHLKNVADSAVAVRIEIIFLIHFDIFQLTIY